MSCAAAIWLPSRPRNLGDIRCACIRRLCPQSGLRWITQRITAFGPCRPLVPNAAFVTLGSELTSKSFYQMTALACFADACGRRKPPAGGLRMKSDGNPMDPTQRLRDAPRCSARAKSTGQRCQCPSKRGWRVCRVHGAGGGAPRGKAHPNYLH